MTEKLQPTVFLVDDQKIINYVNRKIIEATRVSCKLCVFENPLQAIDKLPSEKPEFIFLDIKMPELDGWKFLEIMEERDIYCKVIILTSSTSILDREKSSEFSSVIDYVVKPLSLEKIQKLMNVHCTV